jgi:hypothetical protein
MGRQLRGVEICALRKTVPGCGYVECAEHDDCPLPAMALKMKD